MSRAASMASMRFVSGSSWDVMGLLFEHPASVMIELKTIESAARTTCLGAFMPPPLPRVTVEMVASLLDVASQAGKRTWRCSPSHGASNVMFATSTLLLWLASPFASALNA